MTDEELRAIVRDAIARRQGRPPDPPPAAHSSHAMFLTLAAGGDAGACIIEPAVSCTHCGFCKSYGH